MEMFSPGIAFKFGANLLPKLIKLLVNIKKKRNKDIDKIADIFGDPVELAKFYIEPYCQQFNPADDDDETSHVVRELILSRLEHFFSGSKITGENQLFVLADAGMGKTSLLVMLKLSHLLNFWPHDNECSLLKIGESTIHEIEQIESKRNTILLLDALDEDPQVWGRLTPRLIEILSATKHFKRVVITCRTQFFSGGEDPINRRGKVEVGGYICPTIYLSLFDDNQVNEYCNKRFIDSPEKIDKAFKILRKIKSLRLRPMLLAHIEDLLNSDTEVWDIYSLYNALVSVWLHREARKTKEIRRNITSIDDLRLACRKYAVKLSQSGRKSLSSLEFQIFVSSELVVKNLEAVEIGGRSLLNKNSLDEYRFSHYTIQEFLIAESILKREISSSLNKIPATNLIIDFLLTTLEALPPSEKEQISLSMLDMNNISLRDKDLSWLDIKDVALTQAVLVNSNLTNSNLSGTNLQKADLSNAIFDKTNLTNANMTEAIIAESDLTNANITGTIFKGANFSHSNLKHTNLSGKDLSNTYFINADLSGADLSNANLSYADLTRATLDGIIFSNTDLTNSILSNIDFTKIDISNSFLKNSNFDQSLLTGMDLSMKNLQGVIFDNAYLEGTNFHGANLTVAKFNSRTKFKNVNFTNATMVNCIFEGSLLKNANLTNAVLTSANLKYTDLRNVKLDGANFTDAEIEGAKLTAQDVKLTNLTKKQLQSAVISPKANTTS